ncbi:hypothetical protein [Synechococcus sp. HK01-R]|uniref:TolB family protein n=1 Tax=Synechococcus sp. HK01-R TaxID=2751171 RepID=UPI001627D81F|nr:hypothetical protein [Synechococcus sp. HK01-R]QNG27356.1 hypothetical protein H0O21_01550 [Synechococcus sp. HK01-R]
MNWIRAGCCCMAGLMLSACSPDGIRPLSDLNGRLASSGEARRDPSLAQEWLATLSSRSGRERIELINLRSGQPTPTPGLNRADAQPVSISLSGDGERLALVRQRDGETELMLYRRSLGLMQQLELNPRGVPRQVSLDGRGKLLAVQVSRGGRWEVDLIPLP